MSRIRVVGEMHFEMIPGICDSIEQMLQAEVPAKWVPHPTDKVTMLTSWGYTSTPPADGSFVHYEPSRVPT